MIASLLAGCSLAERVEPEWSEVVVRWADAEISARSAVQEPTGAVAHDVRVTAAQGLDVAADRVRWQRAGGVALFEGNVVVRRGDVEVRADRVEAKVVDGRLTGAAATGGVTVRRGSWNGSAGRAELDAVGATLRLTDGVDVVEPGRRLEAARVTVWLDEERVDCDACRVRFDSAP